MARFLHHEPCPECGSRDNLGRYDDGSAFCFGCKYTEKATHAPRRITTNAEELTTDVPPLPEDTDTNFSAEAVSWLAQFFVPVEEAIRVGVRWSDSRQQLIFLLEGGCWQARNFNEGAAKKRKYFTAGNVNDSIKIYIPGSIREAGSIQGTNSEGPRKLAVVEDCVSAIRVSKQCDAMPVLGSHVSTQKLVRLSHLYESLIIWLDHDKLNEAKKLAVKARLLGMDVKTIYTELDPKCYTDEQIKELLYV